MLGHEQFQALYELLSVDMVEADCGVRCQQFCCGFVKYLLPGEENHQKQSGLMAHARVRDAGVFRYLATLEPTSCMCANHRDARPFCCRIFPFRPVLRGRTVEGIAKVQGERFAPCWVDAVLPTWRRNATEAWRLVLADHDNVRLFAGIGLETERISRNDDGLSIDDLPSLAALSSASDDVLWSWVTRFFQP